MTGNNRAGFRFNAKRLFATYPQCGELTVQSVRDFYQELGATAFTIGREVHADGGYHIHCLVEWPNKYDTRDERKFDINGQHPNVQSARNARAVYQYCIKDGEFLSHGHDGLATTIGKRGYDEACNANTAVEFWEIMKEHHPRDYINNHEKLEYYAAKRYKIDTPEYTSQFTQFNIPPAVAEWITNEKPKVRGDAPLGPAAGYRPDSLFLFYNGDVMWINF